MKAENQEILPEYKVLLLGDIECGKTTLGQLFM